MSNKGLSEKDSNTKDILVSLGIGKINGTKIVLAGSSGGKIFALSSGNTKLVKTLALPAKDKQE